MVILVADKKALAADKEALAADKKALAAGNEALVMDKKILQAHLAGHKYLTSCNRDAHD